MNRVSHRTILFALGVALSWASVLHAADEDAVDALMKEVADKGWRSGYSSSATSA